MEAYCFHAYADALEVIPTTLAENAGLNPIANFEIAMLWVNGMLVLLSEKYVLRQELTTARFDVGMLIGTDIQHLGRRRRSAAVGHNKCFGAIHRDSLSSSEN